MGFEVDGPGSVDCDPDTSERVAISPARWKVYWAEFAAEAMDDASVVRFRYVEVLIARRMPKEGL
jgi:hypothetical protein